MIRVSGPAPQGAGLERVDRPTETLRCGCDVYPADLHDVDDCLEALARGARVAGRAPPQRHDPGGGSRRRPDVGSRAGGAVMAARFIRCALRTGHEGTHLFVKTAMPSSAVSSSA